MADTRYLSTSDVAKMLGVSRITVFKKIKKGDIRATKVGRTYVIDPADVGNILGTALSVEDKQDIEHAVKETVREYGETLRLLGKE